MNRQKFYEYVRRAPFGGRLTPAQKDGLDRILDRWDEEGYDDDRWLAYMLATVFHETAATMQPVEEKGGRAYLKSKPYYPWYGRGLVQITWEENYKKFGLRRPEQALEWGKALDIMFKGMTEGIFTGKKLNQYFNDRIDDPQGARRIINKMDKARLIAGYHQNFLDSINAARASEATEEPQDGDHERLATPLLEDTSVRTVAGSVASSGALGYVMSYVEGWEGVAIVSILGVTALACLTYYFTHRQKEKYENGI